MEEAAAVVVVPQVVRMDHTALFHLEAVHPQAPALGREVVPVALSHLRLEAVVLGKAPGANRLVEVDKVKDIVRTDIWRRLILYYQLFYFS